MNNQPKLSVLKLIFYLTILSLSFFIHQANAGTTTVYKAIECVRDAEGYGLAETIASTATNDSSIYKQIGSNASVSGNYKFSVYTRSGPKSNRSYSYRVGCLKSEEPTEIGRAHV